MGHIQSSSMRECYIPSWMTERYELGNKKTSVRLSKLFSSIFPENEVYFYSLNFFSLLGGGGGGGTWGLKSNGI